MSRLVSRDPFAREELHRTVEYDHAGQMAACPNCGGFRRTRLGRLYLYRYHVETDGGRRYFDNKAFCSASCRTSYLSG